MTTLSVPDISCDHCKMSIEGALGKLAGVSKVEVHVADRTVDVDFTAPTELNSIIRTIEEQGYAVAT